MQDKITKIRQQIQDFRALQPEMKSMSDDQVASIMMAFGQLSLTPEEEISIFSNANKTQTTCTKLDNLESNTKKETFTQNSQPETNETENSIKSTLQSKHKNLETQLKKAEDENGFIGSAWSWIKNTTGLGDSSDKVRDQLKKEQNLLSQLEKSPDKKAEIFKELTGLDFNEENFKKFNNGEIKLKSEQMLDGYKEGQEMVVDITGDIVSGVAAFGIYTAAVAAAPFTGGTSILVGFAAATASGAAIKAGLKVADATSGGREYTLSDLGHDALTGGFSGALAPFTGGTGGAIGKSVAKAIGIQAAKVGTKEAVVQTAKTGAKQAITEALTNPAGYKYIGGNTGKRILAQGTEMATDGAMAGSIDNAFRTGIDGGDASDVGKAALEGFIGGAILSPAIGGGMKAAGNAGTKIWNRNNHIIFHKNLEQFQKDCVENPKFAKAVELLNSKDKNFEQKMLNSEQYNEIKIYISSFANGTNPLVSKDKFHSKINIITDNIKTNNLTNLLNKKQYASYEVETILRQNPHISRGVGALPSTWGKILKSKEGFEKINEIFKDFATTKNLISLKKQLSSILGIDVNVKFLGHGKVGIAYKIEAGNQNFVLKTFFSDNTEWENKGHGFHNEILDALYSKGKTKNVSRFYMGNYGKNAKESYMLTRYIDKEQELANLNKKRANGDAHTFIDIVSRFSSHDTSPDNQFGYKTVDYGLFYPTKANKLNSKEHSILRQICEALDTNSERRIKEIYNKHNGTPELKKALEIFKSELPDIIHNEGELYQRINLLTVFSKDDWAPNIQDLLIGGYASKGCEYALNLIYNINPKDKALLEDILVYGPSIYHNM